MPSDREATMTAFHILKRTRRTNAGDYDDVAWSYDGAVKAETKRAAMRRYTNLTGGRFTGINARRILTKEEWAADAANPNCVANATPVRLEPEGAEGMRRRFDAAVVTVPRSAVPPGEVERVLRDRLRRCDLSVESGAHGRTPERWAARGTRGGWYKPVKVSVGDEFSVGGETWLAFSWADGKTLCVGVMRIDEYEAAVSAGVFKGGARQ